MIGRQLVKTPYINPQDNRMIPNTVEGVAVMRRSDEAQVLNYGAGYLWGFKARKTRAISCRSRRSWASTRIVACWSAAQSWCRSKGSRSVPSTIASPMCSTRHSPRSTGSFPPIGDGLQIRISANYTDQRTVGEDLIAGAPYATSQVSARFTVSYRDATLLAAVSANGDDADLSGPFGSFPAYTVLDQLNFNDAGETTAVIGAAYDFSHLITDGLKFQTRYGRGWGVIDPATGAPQSHQDELNLELEYQPRSGPFENLHFQLFYSGVKLPATPRPTRTSRRCAASSHTWFRCYSLLLDQCSGRLGSFRAGCLDRPSDVICEIDKIDELICLPAQFIGNHRGVGSESRHYGDAGAVLLQGSYQRFEVAIPREQHHVVQEAPQPHRVDGKLDVDLAPRLPTLTVPVLLRRLGDRRVPIVLEPIDERAERVRPVVVDQRRIIERAHELGLLAKHMQQPLEVDAEAERSTGGVKVRAVNENPEALARKKLHSESTQCFAVAGAMLRKSVGPGPIEAANALPSILALWPAKKRDMASR